MDDLAGNTETAAIAHPRRLGTLAILVATIAVAEAPLLVARTLNHEDKNNAFLIAIALPSLLLLVMLGVVLITARTKVVGDLEIVWWRRRRSEARWAILLVLSAVLGSSLVFWCVQRLGLPMESDFGFRADQQSVAFFMALALRTAILAPIVEEVFWRGYVQRTLERLFGGLPALLGQAVLFAALHLQPFGGFVHVFVLGLILGVWRWKRRTLIPVILAHMVGNSLYCAAHWPGWIDFTRIRVTSDYVAQMNELSRPVNYDPCDDARYDYEKAMRLVVVMPGTLDGLRKTYASDWPQQSRQDLRKWVAANEQALNHLARGAKKLYYWPTYKGEDAMSASMPSLRGVRNLAFALNARIQLHASEGRSGPMLSDIVTLYRFGSHFGGRKTLIHQLVGVSIRAMVIGTVRSILSHESLPTETLQELQRFFNSCADSTCVAMDFTLEHLVWLDGIQMSFTDEGNGQGHIPEPVVDGWMHPSKALRSLTDPISSEKKKALLKLERRQTTECVHQLFSCIQMGARKTPWQFCNEPNSIKGNLNDLLQKNAFIDMVASSSARVMELARRARAELDALVTTLAAIRYQRDQGQYPESLNRLVETGYLESVPWDPNSNGPLIYRRTEGNFILYSCGRDFDDDGGMRSKWGEGENGGDQVFWPVPEGS